MVAEVVTIADFGVHRMGLGRPLPRLSFVGPCHRMTTAEVARELTTTVTITSATTGTPRQSRTTADLGRHHGHQGSWSTWEAEGQAAAPLPVLGPGGPALRVGLPLSMRAEVRSC